MLLSMFVHHWRYCVKSVRIRSFSGPYSFRMRENKDQKNFEHRHYSRSKDVYQDESQSKAKQMCNEFCDIKLQDGEAAP